jgi:ABC-type nitrate/sulfonate/bicarbonate transport system substrate-binding protein
MGFSPGAIISRLLAAALCAAAGLAHAQKLETVSLQLKWKHQFQFAGYYAALEKGYYRAAGLDVLIREASGNEDPIGTVLSGKADFGVGASELVLRRALGEPVVLLAAILQRSPLVLLAAGGKDRTVHDLVGRRVMLLPHETELFAYLEREGVRRSDIQQVPHSFDLNDLIQGKVEALSAYSTDETWLLRRSGFRFNMYSPRAAGIEFYGDSLFTTEAQVRRDPGRVEAFRDASVRGWRYAMDHPAEIADLILARYGKRHERDHLLYEAAEMRRLMQPELVEIGHVNPARLGKIAEVYADLGMLPREHSLEGFVFGPLTHAQLARTERWLALASGAAAALALIALLLAWRNLRLRREIRLGRATEAQLRRADELLEARLAEIRELNAQVQRIHGLSPGWGEKAGARDVEKR